MDIPIRFINEPTQQFFLSTKRNQCICGGFGSGKTWIACLKSLLLLTHFNKYRMLFGRQEYKSLIQTTYKTFLKICPPGFIDRWDEQKGYMRLKNGSEILWMHLDAVDEALAKGLEVNSIYIDQPEDVEEGVYTLLDARLARWEKAVPNKALLAANSNWPRDEFGNYRVPAYMMLTPNPDFETHWIYRYYHPDSSSRLDNHDYFEVSTLQNPHLDPETVKVMLSRDPAWVKRYIHGLWGIAEAILHQILPDSYINPADEFLEKIIGYGNCVRALDHGESAPTACLWSSAYKQWRFYYREYYQPNRLISYHRERINEMSEGEFYVANLCDPQMHKQTSQKYDQFWTTALEYTDERIDAPPLHFTPADNNELATRNRINEGLALNDDISHPITGEKPAPVIYFVKKTEKRPCGISTLTEELRSQRREKITEINGKTIYSDTREKSIADHLYDTFRYTEAFHNNAPPELKRVPKPNSFYGRRQAILSLQKSGQLNRYGGSKATI